MDFPESITIGDICGFERACGTGVASVDLTKMGLGAPNVDVSTCDDPGRRFIDLGVGSLDGAESSLETGVPLVVRLNAGCIGSNEYLRGYGEVAFPLCLGVPVLVGAAVSLFPEVTGLKADFFCGICFPGHEMCALALWFGGRAPAGNFRSGRLTLAILFGSWFLPDPRFFFFL